MTAAEEKAALDKELMAQKLVQAEREAQASLREQRAAHEEDLQRLQREKVRAAGSGRAGPWAAVSSVTLGVSSFSLCLRLPICEMELHVCSRGPGDNWEDPLGTPYQTCRFPGPKSGPALVILIQGIHNHIWELLT